MAKLTKEELQEFKEINTAYQQAIFDGGEMERCCES